MSRFLSTQLTGSLIISSSASSSLVVAGSGSTLFSVDGASGRLLEITDDLTNSLFSANTIAGIPVVEVFADNTVRLGKFGEEGIIVTGSGKDVRIGSGSKLFVSASGLITAVGPIIVTGPVTASGFSGTGSYSLASLTSSYSVSSSHIEYVNIDTNSTLIGYNAAAYNMSNNIIAIGSNVAAEAVSLDTGETIIGNEAARKFTNPAASAQPNVIIGVSASYAGSGSMNVIVGSHAAKQINGITSLYGNVVIGYESLSTLTADSGSNFSVVIGYQAMKSAPGFYGGNVVIGANALESGSGPKIVAIGYAAGRALRNITGVTNNVIIGYEAGALSSASNFADNMFLGSNAGYDNQGHNNVFMGTLAGRYSGPAQNSVYLGYQSGDTLPGNYNIVIGNQSAHQATTTTAYNFAFGYLALRYLHTNGYNIAFGNYALESSSMSNTNLVIGHEGGRYAGGTNPHSNTVIGHYAWQGQSASPSIDSYRNVVVGQTAFRYIGSSSYQNVVIGNDAVGQISYTLHGLSNSVYIGYQAGYYGGRTRATTGNIGIGVGALYNGGTYNIAMGYAAMQNAVDTSTYNTSIGYMAGQNLSSSYNVILGHQAARSYTGENAAEGYNILIGNQAGYQILTGSNVIAIGNQAAFNAQNSITSSLNNLIAIGSEAARNAKDDIIAIGNQAGYSNETGGSSIAIGNFSLRSQTTGFSNTAVGNNAMYNTKTGVQNFALGNNSLYINQVGSYNVAIGGTAMQNVPTASSAIAIGYGAADGTWNRAGSIAIGEAAYYNSGPGNYQIGIGYGALRNNFGQGNVFLGHQIDPMRISSASWNVALGVSTLGQGHSDYGTMLGAYAGYAVTGSANIGIGYWTLGRYITGSFNVGIGNEVAWAGGVGASSSYYNVFVGYRAGYTNFRTGSNNVLLGSQTDYDTGISTLELTSSVALGANVKLRESNTVVIGAATNVRVGIGTPNPQASLHVISGSAIIQAGVTASGFFGTASWARDAISASYAPGSAVSASYADVAKELHTGLATYTLGGALYVRSGSMYITGSPGSSIPSLVIRAPASNVAAQIWYPAGDATTGDSTSLTLDTQGAPTLATTETLMTFNNSTTGVANSLSWNINNLHPWSANGTLGVASYPWRAWLSQVSASAVSSSTVYAGDKIGIGTITPSEKLFVSGNIRMNNGANTYLYGQVTESYVKLDSSGAHIGSSGYSMFFESVGITLRAAGLDVARIGTSKTFYVQNASGQKIFEADPTNDIVYIGNGTTASTNLTMYGPNLVLVTNAGTAANIGIVGDGCTNGTHLQMSPSTGYTSQLWNYENADIEVGTNNQLVFTVSKSLAVDFADREIVRARLRDYTETVASASVSSNTATLNLNAGNVFVTTLDANITTMNIVSAGANGSGSSFTWIVNYTGNNSITWNTAIEWPSNTAPTLTAAAGKTDIFTFVAINAAGRWYGFTAGQNYDT